MTTMRAANRPGGVAQAAAAAAVILLAIYLPALGRGFVKDDFGWILAARVHEWADLLRIVGSNVGFYRPLVTLTFSLDHALWGLNPYGYGLTNLALCVANAALIYALACRFQIPRAAALAGAAVWVFNFHAVNMALLWLSGRTALLVTLFALGTTHAMLAGRRLAAGALCLCALLSKEEAVMLPALLSAFAVLGPQGSASSPVVKRLRNVLERTWALWLALAIYLLLRSRSGAFGPSGAPWYYQFSFDPALLARNLLEYADRAGTTAAIAVIVVLAYTGWKRLRFPDGERAALLLAVLWIPAAYALTMFLPVRSSLYALLPSVGSALIAAAVSAAASRADPVAFRRAAITLLVLAALLVPVYWSRNDRWTDVADVSARVMSLVEAAAARRASGHVVLLDDPAAPVTFDETFSGLFPAAVQVFAGGGWNGEVLDRAAATVPPGTTVVIEMRDGAPAIGDPEP